MPSQFALIDCNNFYVSCERVFRPALKNKPVVVLSNNDGCIISRSAEAKALNIEMGVPFFKVKDLIKKYKVAVFSSNYALYGDFSQRVMETLSQFSPEIEYYSIDEAFLDLSSLKDTDLVEYGKKIKKTVKQYTGIPISVGMAPTKTLTKVANHLAKSDPSYGGVCLLFNPKEIDEVLKNTPIEKIWGIGFSYTKLLYRLGILNGYDFRAMPRGWIQHKMGVIGLRMIEELYGNSCLDLELISPPKKGICSSRSFGESITNLSDLEEAISTYVARAAEKMREQAREANVIIIFIHSSRFRENFYRNSALVRLSHPTSHTPELIEHALNLLKKIYKEGIRYKKAGVLLEDLTPVSQAQRGLFDLNNREQSNQLMETIDRLNLRMGEGTVKIAAQGLKQSWAPKVDLRSPRYTTSWDELKEVY